MGINRKLAKDLEARLEQGQFAGFGKLAEFLRREKLGIARTALAKAMGYSTGYADFIKRVEEGRALASPSLVRKYAEHFGLKKKFLLELDRKDLYRLFQYRAKGRADAILNGNAAPTAPYPASSTRPIDMPRHRHYASLNGS